MINLNGLTGSGVSRSDSSDKAPGEVGQEDFLKLMVAQLQNQDPFSPMENGEFLAQIAQFTTATGIQDLQQSFNRFSQNMATEQALQAAGLVGRTVVVESDAGYLPADGSLTGTMQLPVPIQNSKLSVYAESGALLREIPLGPQEAGEVDFSWDGRDADGREMQPGRYSVSVTTILDGEEWEVPTYVSADVQSVALGAKGEQPTLSLAGLGDVKLSSVSRIR